MAGRKEARCCARMTEMADHRCERHPDEFDCPDNLIHHSQEFDEYGLIVHDGGSSSVQINYCPWCGTKLPESKRDQ